MPSVKPLGTMGCYLGGVTNLGLPGLDRGRVGQQSLKVAERSHGWFLHDEPLKFDGVYLQESSGAINERRQRPLPLHKALSAPWILRLYLSCFHGSVEEMWGHPRQVAIWVVQEGPGWEGA